MSEPPQHPSSLSGPDCMGGGIFLVEMWELRLKMLWPFGEVIWLVVELGLSLGWLGYSSVVSFLC